MIYSASGSKNLQLGISLIFSDTASLATWDPLVARKTLFFVGADITVASALLAYIFRLLPEVISSTFAGTVLKI